MRTFLTRPILLLLLCWLSLAAALPAQTRATPAPAPAAVEDLMPVGRTWTGADDGGTPMTIRVVARDVAAKTATLRLIANNGWKFDVDVTTQNGGKTFQVVNARRVDQRVRITREGGSGRCSKSELALGLSWTYDRGHRHGQNAKKIQGRR